MTIRLASPPGSIRPRMSVRTAREACRVPCNDNGTDGKGDELLHAALRHFAEHGLAAAHRARKQAEAAFFAGDRQAYKWWLDICRALDRRMAMELGLELQERRAEIDAR